MRYVLCDEDRLVQSMVESIVTRLGHDVIGVADTTATASDLVAHARPDVVVLDLSLGYNTDFDVIEAAEAVGAKVVVFSANADDATLRRYATRPAVVAKPDFVALEQLVERLGIVADPSVANGDRRRRPSRAAAGPAPMSLGDAQAFYEALHNAIEGDTLVSIDPVDDGGGSADGTDIAALVVGLIRETDRLLASPATVKVFLAGGAEHAIESLLGRLKEVSLPSAARVRSVVITATETGADGFDRLKHLDEEHQL